MRPPILLPYQARWYRSRGPWRVAAKSRQIGLTWCEGGRQATIAASSRAGGGRNCLYVSTSLMLAREYIEMVATWAAAMHGRATHKGLTVLHDGREDILAHEVRFASGHKVVGVSSNPAAFRGRRGEVLIDEGAHHVRLEEILKAAFAVTRTGGEVAVISTHNGANNRFAKLCKEVRGGKLRGTYHETSIHQALADGLFRRFCTLNSRPWSAEAEAEYLRDCLASPGAKEEFELIVSHAGAQFYREELLAKCSRRDTCILHLQRDADWELRAPDDRRADTRAWCDTMLAPALFGLASDKRHYLGKDFARRVDLSAIAVLEQNMDFTLGTPVVVELRNVPDDEQEQISDYMLSAVPLCAGYALDTTEGGGRNEAERLGSRWGNRDLIEGGLIVPVRLNAGWYDREHHRLRQRLEERDLWVPRDEDIFEDLQSWRLGENNRLELGPKTTSRRDGLMRHGDVGLAILLAQHLAPDTPQGPKYRELSPVEESRPVPTGRRNYMP